MGPGWLGIDWQEPCFGKDMLSRKVNRWLSIAKGIWVGIGQDQVEVMAGGVAFFGTLSLFPAIAVLVLVYGLFANPAELEGQLSWVAQSLVPLARDVLRDSLRLAGTARTTFGFGALGALLLAVYGASRATNAVLLSIQVASGDKETRGFLSQLRLNLTITASVLVSVGLLLVPFAAAPGVLSRLGIDDSVIKLLQWLRWPCLWFAFFTGVLFLYRFAPQKMARRRQARFWPGALAATIAWTLVSWGFSFYAAKLGGYAGTYGPAAAFAVFMTWVYLTSFIIIAGAELNSELYLQAAPSRAVTSEVPGQAAQR